MNEVYNNCYDDSVTKEFDNKIHLHEMIYKEEDILGEKLHKW